MSSQIQPDSASERESRLDWPATRMERILAVLTQPMSVRELSVGTGMNERRVQSAINELRLQELVRVHRVDGHTKYWVITEKQYVPFPRTAKEAFERKINKNGGEGCWIWTACKSTNGYGRFRDKSAHRAAWEFYRGPIPDGLFVCHTCDVRLCVNPSHMFLGTCKDNLQDAARKGRLRPPHFCGEKHPRAKLTEQQVERIRASGGTQREIAQKFGISVANIYYIQRGLTWKK